MRSYEWVTKNQDELVTKRVNAAQQMFAQHEAERGGGEAQPGSSETSRTLS